MPVFCTVSRDSTITSAPRNALNCKAAVSSSPPSTAATSADSNLRHSTRSLTLTPSSCLRNGGALDSPAAERTDKSLTYIFLHFQDQSLRCALRTGAKAVTANALARHRYAEMWVLSPKLSDVERTTVDISEDPMVSVQEAAQYLSIPASTLGEWRRNRAIHSVRAERHGWPTLPFAAVVEAFVLRALRELNFTRRQILEAAEGIRRDFNDDFGLVRPNIGHDGVEIFIEVGPDLYRAKDRQQVIRETVEGFTRCIVWTGIDPQRLKLEHFGNVILDPRFGWGRPVVEDNKVPIYAILGLWRAGESPSTIADEFEMTARDVERLFQAWDRARDAA